MFLSPNRRVRYWNSARSLLRCSLPGKVCRTERSARRVLHTRFTCVFTAWSACSVRAVFAGVQRENKIPNLGQKDRQTTNSKFPGRRLSLIGFPHSEGLIRISEFWPAGVQRFDSRNCTKPIPMRGPINGFYQSYVWLTLRATRAFFFGFSFVSFGRWRRKEQQR